MTTPTPDGIAAAVTAYGQAQYAAGRADQALADQQTVASLQKQLADETAKDQQDEATITALQAQVAQLEAELNPQPPPPPPAKSAVLYGSGIGGWWQTLKETRPNAYARITQTLAGKKGYLPVIRLFGSDVPSYVDSRTRVFLDTGNAASVQQIAALGQRGPGQLLSVIHEPENKTDIASWQAAQVAHAKLVAANGGGNVALVPLLMGQSFMPSRKPNHPASAWFDFDMTGIDYIGADLYQWGHDDASADTAEAVFGGAVDLAKQLGKKLVVGELGARRPNPPYRPGISDTARAKFLTDVIALCDANADVVAAVTLFESDNGSSNMVPWPITHPANDAYSPLAVAAWASACNR